MGFSYHFKSSSLFSSVLSIDERLDHNYSDPKTKRLRKYLRILCYTVAAIVFSLLSSFSIMLFKESELVSYLGDIVDNDPDIKSDLKYPFYKFMLSVVPSSVPLFGVFLFVSTGLLIFSNFFNLWLRPTVEALNTPISAIIIWFVGWVGCRFTTDSHKDAELMYACILFSLASQLFMFCYSGELDGGIPDAIISLGIHVAFVKNNTLLVTLTCGISLLIQLIKYMIRRYIRRIDKELQQGNGVVQGPNYGPPPDLENQTVPLLSRSVPSATTRDGGDEEGYRAPEEDLSASEKLEAGVDPAPAEPIKDSGVTDEDLESQFDDVHDSADEDRIGGVEDLGLPTSSGVRSRFTRKNLSLASPFSMKIPSRNKFSAPVLGDDILPKADLAPAKPVTRRISASPRNKYSALLHDD